MPSPSSSLATLRPELGSVEEFNLQADRMGFIGTDVLPVLEVGVQAGAFGRIPIEQLLQNRDTVRAPGSGYSRGKFTFAPDSYACVENGAEEVVDDRQAKMYRNYFDAEQVAADRARDVVLREMEKRIAALVFNTTTWTGASLTTAVAVKWDVPATAVPITNVKAAAAKIYANSGMWPDTLIINRVVANLLPEVTQIIDRVKYSGHTDPKNITAAALAQLFDVDRVLIAGSPKNTANEGAAMSLAPIWASTMAMLCKTARTNDMQEPGIGRVFHWGEDGSDIGATIETYREEGVRGEVVRARNDVDEKIIYVEAGHLMTGIT